MQRAVLVSACTVQPDIDPAEFLYNSVCKFLKLRINGTIHLLCNHIGISGLCCPNLKCFHLIRIMAAYCHLAALLCKAERCCRPDSGGSAEYYCYLPFQS